MNPWTSGRQAHISVFSAIMLALMASCLLNAGSSVAEIPWHDNLAQALEAAETAGKPVFLDLYADWCEPCHVMDREVFPDEAVARSITRHFIPLRLDVDRNRDLAEKYQVLSVPTMLILEKDGQPSGRLIGLLPPEELVNQLTESLQFRDELLRLENEAKEKPDDAGVIFEFGQAAWMLDRYETATQQLQKAVDLDPAGAQIGIGTASILLARSYGALGQIEPAITVLERLQKNHPESDHRFEASFFLGVLELDNDRFEKAKAYLQAAVEAPSGALDPEMREHARYILAQLP